MRNRDPKGVVRKGEEPEARAATKPEPAAPPPVDVPAVKRPDIADMPVPVEDSRPATKGAKADDAKPAEVALSETRFARLRKKKDMPEGLWLKCERCGQMIYRKELEEKGRVCPACEFHFTLPGRERIAMVLDPGTWKEHFAGVRTIDRLAFHDQIPYLDKVKKAETRTGQTEALLCGTGAV